MELHHLPNAMADRSAHRYRSGQLGVGAVQVPDDTLGVEGPAYAPRSVVRAVSSTDRPAAAPGSATSTSQFR